MNMKKFVSGLITVMGITLVSSYAFAVPKDITFLAQCPTVANFLSKHTTVYSTVNNNTVTWKGYNGTDKIQSFNGAIFSNCSATTKACSISCAYTATNKSANTVSVVLTPLNRSHLFLSPIPTATGQVGGCKNSDPSKCQFNAFENDLTKTNNKTRTF